MAKEKPILDWGTQGTTEKWKSNEKKITSQRVISANFPTLIIKLGILHIGSVVIYSLSQSFFAHHSGNMFYFFLIVVFYAVLKQIEKSYISGNDNEKNLSHS